MTSYKALLMEISMPQRTWDPRPSVGGAVKSLLRRPEKSSFVLRPLPIYSTLINSILIVTSIPVLPQAQKSRSGFPLRNPYPRLPCPPGTSLISGYQTSSTRKGCSSVRCDRTVLMMCGSVNTTTMCIISIRRVRVKRIKQPRIRRLLLLRGVRMC